MALNLKQNGVSLIAGVVIGLIICYFAHNLDMSTSFSLKGVKS